MSERQSHRKVLIIGGVVAIIMFAFSFALVPVYNLICKATGINTSVRSEELIKPAVAAAYSKDTEVTRNVTVQFIAVHHMGMPWDFHPNIKSVIVHPGVSTKVTFYAKNNTDHDMVAQAIPSMTPVEAISHFHKIECFCFRQQPLRTGESKDMPLVFQVDKDLPKDIHVITLAYTLFDATSNMARKKS
jgi:cytochrome c oxidase assembly protein subunit 11